MKRYNYDRFVNGRKMAEGLAVHAATRESADIMAAKLDRKPTSINGMDYDEYLISCNTTIKFRDNKPCLANCGVCRQRQEEYIE